MSPAKRSTKLTGSQSDPGRKLAQAAGVELLCGADEAGRGPLAGPVVAAAVILRLGQPFPPVADSKALSPAQRLALLDPIRQAAAGHAVAVGTVQEIDALGILRASLTAMHRAVQEAWAMAGSPDCVVVVDGRDTIPGLALPQHAMVKGDAKCAAVAAASILAKEHRDALMMELHQQFPAYGFDQHKGYATSVHTQALVQHGPCPHHRRSFDPVKTFLATGQWSGPAQLTLL